MTARRIYIPEAMPSRDANGRALPAFLRFYEPTGTFDLLKPVYADDSLSVLLEQPVESNVLGQFPAIWADEDETFDAGWYSQSTGRTLGTYENVTPVAAMALLSDLESAVDEAGAAVLEAQEAVVEAQAAVSAAAGEASAASESAGAAAIAAATAAATVTEANLADLLFNYFVDGLVGSDSNAGTSRMKAFASLTPLASLTLASGTKIGLARGLSLRQGLTSSVSTLTVSSLGSGAQPVLDCSDVITGWTLTSGETVVYEKALSGLPGNSKILGNTWENDTFLTQVTSKAACAALPGSCYVTNWASATPTVYIHATDSSNPNTNGRTYTVSVREYAINITADDAIVRDICTRRNANQDGSIRVTGERALIQRVRVEDGCRHAAYVGAECLIERSYFYRARNDLEVGGSANLVVINQPSITGKKYATRYNTLDGGNQPSVTGWQNHGASPSDLFATIRHEGDTFINLSACASGQAVNHYMVGPVFQGCAECFTLGATGVTAHISGGSGTLNRLYNAEAGVTVNSTGNVITVPDLGGSTVGFYRTNSASGDVTLNISGDQISVVDCTASNARIVYHQRGAVTINGATFKLPGTQKLCAQVNHAVYAGFGGGTATFAGGGNTYPYGAAFYLNGTTYWTLAAWQAAGYDAGSTTTQPNTPVDSDDFNRADENLEVTKWTRIGGAAAQAAVRSNALACIGTTQTLYSLEDMASPDHYIRFKVSSVPATAGPYVVLRAIDQNNWMGIRWNAATWQFGTCIAGTLTTAALSNTAVTPAVGQDVIVAVKGGKVWLYVDGRTLERGVSVSAAALASAVKVGVVPRGTAINPLLDDFKCGLI